jgi:hypothetical protein
LAAAASSCRRDGTQAAADPEWIRLEGDRIERQHRLEVLRIQLARLDASQEADAVSLTELESQRASLATLASRQLELRDEIAGLEEKKEAQRRDFLRAARERSVGRQFPELALASGRRYQQAVVTGVTDAGIQIRHATGSARIGGHDLSADQCEEFSAREKADALAYERWIDQQLAAKAADESKNAARSAIPAVAPLRSRENTAAFAAYQAPDPQAETSPLRQRPRYFGGVQFRYEPRRRSRTVYYYNVCPVYQPAIWQPSVVPAVERTPVTPPALPTSSDPTP